MEHEFLAWFLDRLASNNAIKIGKAYVPSKIIFSFQKVAFENIP
jgi:hypothetical protein